MKANIAEIFTSIQGEGLLVGTRQLFVRFSGCNLHCSYCDTPASRQPCSLGLIHNELNSMNRVRKIHNPIFSRQLLQIIGEFTVPWISFTGGEPLLAAEFLAEVTQQTKMMGYKNLLETNGTLFAELEKCLWYIDMISIDFKLPSATGRDFWEEHLEFLFRAYSRPCYVKVVITPETRDEEVDKAVNIIASVNPAIPLFLQPVTVSPGKRATDMKTVLSYQTRALNTLHEVRVLPQIHTYLGLP